ncbi:HNH endonuclease signature motif containing protein [Streptomyces sp. NPDC048611]|uniref:HNH endonuclease signature motif containing protein n=1 Tax=Streptomyces sp. NPDC048611 TaxID=3155635 RepID=UPI0034314490
MTITYGHHPSTELRFWSKVNKQGPMPPQAIAPGLCWEWTGSKTPGGYGQFWVKPRLVVSHRFAYEQVLGPIPDGLQLDHLCRNRACVNPQHLEPVTQQVNIWRGFSIATANRLKTHCPHGHPYSAENTYIHPKNNGRICRACARERSRKNHQRKRNSS